ncbi:MAG: hypothetical protein WA110_07020 [Anaerolineaceae bacterium]
MAAAKHANVSERQIHRIQRAYREKGEQGLARDNQGKNISKKDQSGDQGKNSSPTAQEPHKDYNSGHFQEILFQKYGISRQSN